MTKCDSCEGQAHLEFTSCRKCIDAYAENLHLAALAIEESTKELVAREAAHSIEEVKV